MSENLLPTDADPRLHNIYISGYLCTMYLVTQKPLEGDVETFIWVKTNERMLALLKQAAPLLDAFIVHVF